jgi:hypothetical protein
MRRNLRARNPNGLVHCGRSTNRTVTVRPSFMFNRRKALANPDHNAQERVLMVFPRSDTNDADVGK